MRAYDVHKAVKVTLDKERFLYFNIAALMELERLAGGKSVYQMFVALSKGDASLTFLVQGFAAGLKYEDPSITVEKAAELIQDCLLELDQGEDFNQALTTLTMALTDAVMKSGVLGKPKPEERVGEDEAKPPRHRKK